MSLALLAPRTFSAELEELNRQLMLAAEKGDLPNAQAALAGGADPNARVPGTSLNYTPLHQAVGEGHREIAELLLEHGANPYLEDENQDPVLVFVSPSNNGRAMLRLLLDWKVPIDSKNSDGITALMRSVGFPDDGQHAALLLECGADPNLRRGGGITPLMSAAEHTDARQLMVLLKAGADVNAQDDAGNTPLMHADTACVKPLLEAGANVNLASKAGETPLMFALGSKEGIDLLLLEHGADPKAVTEKGATLLMLAAAQRLPETVRLLLSRRADAKARDRDGQTAVHYAAGASHYYHRDPKEIAADLAKTGTIINLLVSAGADLKAVDAEGRSALHLAAGTGYVEIVRLLLEMQFDPNQAMNDGRTPLYLAIDGPAISSGEQQDAGEKVRLLLASGAAPDAVDKEGRSPLLSAIELMDRDITLLLIEKGASVDRLAKSGLTPLLLAARRFHDQYVLPENYAAIVAALAAKTTAPDARDGLGMTPLMWAAASDVPAAVEALLAQHADLNARAGDGRTALMWAASANAGRTIKVLLEKGADKSLKDNAGRTASAWAKWMGQSRALDLLGDEAP